MASSMRTAGGVESESTVKATKDSAFWSACTRCGGGIARPVLVRLGGGEGERVGSMAASGPDGGGLPQLCWRAWAEKIYTRHGAPSNVRADTLRRSNGRRDSQRTIAVLLVSFHNLSTVEVRV